MADLMNKALNTSHLSALSNNSFYLEYYNAPILLDQDIPFEEAPKLLFSIPTNKGRLIDLHVDNFISICLDKVIDDYYQAKQCFDVVTNTFDLVFKRIG